MGAYEKPSCPECGSEEVIPIVYGLPAPDLVKKAMYGEVMLGGCIVHEEDPDRFCCSCGAKWKDVSTRGLVED